MKNKSELLPVTVNAEEAARLFGISRSSIFGLIAKKSIPSMIIAGRRVILYSDLSDFARQQISIVDPGAQLRVSRAIAAARSKRRPSPTGKASTMERA